MSVVITKNDVSPLDAALVPASPVMLEKLMEAQRRLLQCRQVEVVTEHLIHGGMYVRTIRREPGVLATGSLMLKPSVLIINGDCTLIIGDRRFDLTGYNVLPGCKGRKQLSRTNGPVEMTMIFPTYAKTVEDAENEIFAEAEGLMSRQNVDRDTILITGE